MDDKVLYDDSASILNYASNTNLYDYISLGDISKNSSCALQFDLQLSSEYQKISNNKFAYLHYSFYSLDSDKDYVEIKPFSKEVATGILFADIPVKPEPSPSISVTTKLPFIVTSPLIILSAI